jgi:predicted HicB family RNase H-like nuclease
MSRMARDDKFSMRLPADLKAELQRRADAEDRSLAAYIVLALQKHVEETSELKSKSRK